MKLQNFDKNEKWGMTGRAGKNAGIRIARFFS